MDDMIFLHVWYSGILRDKIMDKKFKIDKTFYSKYYGYWYRKILTIQVYNQPVKI